MLRHTPPLIVTRTILVVDYAAHGTPDVGYLLVGLFDNWQYELLKRLESVTLGEYLEGKTPLVFFSNCEKELQFHSVSCVSIL